MFFCCFFFSCFSPLFCSLLFPFLRMTWEKFFVFMFPDVSCILSLFFPMFSSCFLFFFLFLFFSFVLFPVVPVFAYDMGKIFCFYVS